MCTAFEEFDRQMEFMRSQLTDKDATIADKDATIADKDAKTKKGVLRMLRDKLSLETIMQYTCLEPKEIYSIATGAGLPLPV